MHRCFKPRCSSLSTRAAEDGPKFAAWAVILAGDQIYKSGNASLIGELVSALLVTNIQERPQLLLQHSTPVCPVRSFVTQVSIML
jgi:endo-1,4-beta-D-glucanase Y